MPARAEPIVVPALSPPEDTKHSAAIIFMHGLGDDASGFENIARQFQSAQKLPHMQWVFPNALENRDAMQTAWYSPTRLSPFATSRPELDDDEDGDGLKQSRDYIVSLIDSLVAKGTPLNRIVIGGFSQGHALTMMIGLTSKYSGKFAGLLGLAGYMPLAEKMQELRAEAALPPKMGDLPIFLMRGSKDMLVPKRYLRICEETLKEFGVTDSALEVHEYEGLGHSVSAPVLRDMCLWLEKVLPATD